MSLQWISCVVSVRVLGSRRRPKDFSNMHERMNYSQLSAVNIHHSTEDIAVVEEVERLSEFRAATPFPPTPRTMCVCYSKHMKPKCVFVRIYLYC